MEPEIYEVEQRFFALLMIRLDRLIRRRTPVRNVSAGPVQRTARLRFGDGTTLIVRSQRAGNSAAVMGAILEGHPVLLEKWQWDDGGLILTLAVPAGRRVIRHRVILLGDDQPD